MSKIAFIGTGIIGAGLAVNALAAGNECTLYDVVDLQTAKDRIKGIFDTMVEAGAYTQEKADAAYAKASFTNNLKEAVTDAVFIQEAVPERIELKRSIFKQIQEICTCYFKYDNSADAFGITGRCFISGENSCRTSV